MGSKKNFMGDKCWVYGLKAKDASEYFYVGSTKHDPAERLKAHLADVRKRRHTNNHLASTIRKIGPENVTVELLGIASSKDRFERENYWIEKLKAEGCGLTNIAIPGQIPPSLESSDNFRQYTPQEYGELIKRNREFCDHTLLHMAKACDYVQKVANSNWRALSLDEKKEIIATIKDCEIIERRIQLLVESPRKQAA